MEIESKLSGMGLALPAEMQVPPGFRINWRQVRVVGSRGVIAGHGPRQANGSELALNAPVIIECEAEIRP